MKVLHTADLHLGKIFHDQSLADDQAAMLDDLARILEEGSFAALVVAGDVYDRSIPSPDAVGLFGPFLERVKKIQPSPEILVIPGNHDSAQRLGYGRELFARLGIRLGVSAEDCDKPVIVEKDGETCAFFMIPFLNSGSISAAEKGEFLPLHSQSAMAEETGRRMEKARRSLPANQGVDYSVLAAHLFASGGREAGSERVFLGAAELVNISLFEGFDYIALGHLHRCQSAGKNAWYSGSPLAYSFSEAGQEKFFLSVELAKNETKVEKIPVKPRRRVTSLCGPFARFSGAASAEGPEDPELLSAAKDYLEIRLSDREITENARDILRKRFPYLLSLRQDEALAGLSSMTRIHTPSERQSVAGDFKNFLASLYGEADNKEIDLFNKLLKEIEDEESAS